MFSLRLYPFSLLCALFLVPHSPSQLTSTTFAFRGWAVASRGTAAAAGCTAAAAAESSAEEGGRDAGTCSEEENIEEEPNASWREPIETESGLGVSVESVVPD